MTKIGVTVLASGSNGNCVAIHSEDRTLLVDCGISKSELIHRLELSAISPDTIKGILLTHAHGDHVKGVDLVARTLEVPVYATSACFDGLKAHIEKYSRKKECTLLPRLFQVGYTFECAQFQVTPFPVEHDADTVGYVLTTPRGKIGIATDVGTPTHLLETFLRDCHTLVLESNYDQNMLIQSPRSWDLKHRICGGHGHLSTRQAAELLPRLVTRNTRNVILAHTSGDCNHYQLALDAAQEALHSIQRDDIFLECGRRDGAIPTRWLN